jgi:hypothetical protein
MVAIAVPITGIGGVAGLMTSPSEKLAVNPHGHGFRRTTADAGEASGRSNDVPQRRHRRAPEFRPFSRWQVA